MPSSTDGTRSCRSSELLTPCHRGRQGSAPWVQYPVYPTATAVSTAWHMKGQSRTQTFSTPDATDPSGPPWWPVCQGGAPLSGRFCPSRWQLLAIGAHRGDGVLRRRRAQPSVAPWPRLRRPGLDRPGGGATRRRRNHPGSCRRESGSRTRDHRWGVQTARRAPSLRG